MVKNPIQTVAYIGTLGGLSLLAGFVIARGQILFFPAPGTRVTGLTISEYDAQGSLLVALGLAIVVGAFLIPRLVRGLHSSFLVKLLAVAFAAKMVGAMIRAWTGAYIYGYNDVGRYNRIGEPIAKFIHHMDFDAIAPFLQIGTQFTMFYTGVVYALIGPTLYGGFLVFGFLSFLGSVFFYRAFLIAFPDSQHRFYGLLVFLYPSVLFWSNGIGKDALMALFIGLAALGSAILLRRGQFYGLIPLIIGLAGTATIRPHITGMLVLGMLAAFVLGKATAGYKPLMVKMLILILGIGLVGIFTPKIMAYVGIDDLSVASTVEYYNYRQGTTGELQEGGSAFQAPSISDPFFVPKAFVTVLFRPFPWEANNLGALIQALDGALLVGLMVWRAPSLVKAILSGTYDMLKLTWMLTFGWPPKGKRQQGS